jgi:hypothetical protein
LPLGKSWNHQNLPPMREPQSTAAPVVLPPWYSKYSR